MSSGSWTNDRPCCVMTWATLALLGEIAEAFPNAGDVKMKDLVFWAGSAQTREARARALAVQMDNTFISLFNSEYETKVNRTRAILNLTESLLDGSATMTDLANSDDDDYLFMGE